MATQLISSDWVNAGRIIVTMDDDAVVKVGQQFAGTTPVTAAVVFEDALPAAPSLGQSISIQAGPPQIISYWNRTTHAWVTLSDAERDELLELTDTPSSYSGQTLKVLRVNAGETAVEFAEPVDTVLELTDTPSSYSGETLKVLRVNAGETAIEFAEPVDTTLELTDTPSSYAGEAHKALRVNAGETAVEFLDPTEPVGPNLLINGSFETASATGLAEGWSTTFSSAGNDYTLQQSAAQAQHGSFAQQMIMSGALNPRIYQTFSTVVGRTYRLRIRSRADLANVSLRLATGTNTAGLDLFAQGVIGDSTWRETTTTFVPTTDTTTFIAYYNGSGSGNLWLDEASVVELDSAEWIPAERHDLEYAASRQFGQTSAAPVVLASNDGGGLTIGGATETVATTKTAGLYEDWAGGTGAWSVTTGTMELDADGMYLTNTSAHARRDFGQSDIDFTYDETYNGDIGGFLARYADASNHIRGYPSAATFILEYRVGVGGYVNIATGVSTAGAVISGTTYRWRVRIVGDRIRTWRDGEAMSDATIPAGAVALQTNTSHGFRTTTAGANRWVRAWLRPVVTGQVLLADQLHIDNAPAYDSDALAGTGGVHAGEVWQTTASHTLGVAGILMIKQ